MIKSVSLTVLLLAAWFWFATLFLQGCAGVWEFMGAASSQHTHTVVTPAGTFTSSKPNEPANGSSTFGTILNIAMAALGLGGTFSVSTIATKLFTRKFMPGLHAPIEPGGEPPTPPPTLPQPTPTA